VPVLARAARCRALTVALVKLSAAPAGTGSNNSTASLWKLVALLAFIVIALTIETERQRRSGHLAKS
jgi:hypothetical protein